MADIRISGLPSEPTPNAADVLAIDGATTRKTSIQAAVEIGRPAASQAEAEAGTNPTKVMTPLTTKQAIAANVGTTAGTVAAGDDSRIVNAVQTSRTLTGGTGIATIGDLSTDRTVSLNAASIASLALADDAVLNADTSTASMLFVIDEDNMSSDSATKVPTQQSTKAYVDAATTVTQVFTGAVARPSIAKLKDGPISLEDAGFVSGNALAALNLALASGAPIKLKAGKYSVNGLPNTVTNTPVSLEGHGPGMSILEFTGATSGLTINQDDYTHPTFIKNLLLQTTHQESGDALTITYSKADSITNRAVGRCVLEDVWARGDVVTSAGWANGIKCTDVHNLSIVRPIIAGRKDNAASGPAIFKNMTSGISLIGSDTPTLSADPSDILIDAPRIYHGNNGIKALGEIEGLNVNTPFLVAVDFGVNISYTTQRPWSKIEGGHVNVFSFGVKAVNNPQMVVKGLVIYKSPGTTGDTYAVALDGCHNSTISDLTLVNQCSDAAVSGQWNGINVANTNDSTFENIRHASPSKTVILSGTSTGNKTRNLQPSGTYTNATVATYDDVSSGTNEYSGGNKPIASIQNAGAVTILNAFTAAASTASLTVYKGERYLVQGNMNATKGATAGDLLTQITKVAGTSTGVFGAGLATILERGAQAISATVAHSVSGIFTVTASGTLALSLGGTSVGSNSTVAIGDAQLSVTLL